mgnify:CR=1 FL=1
MAKRRGKTKKRGGHHPQQATPEAAREKARLILEALQVDGAAASLWGDLHRALADAGIQGGDIMPLILARDMDAISAALDRLDQGLSALDQSEEAEQASPTEDVPDDIKRQAMKAFRKRLKLTRLDHESRLGVGPLTGGKNASFDSILPPHEFPDVVWKALAAEGQLESTGRGFYQLPSSQ